MINILYVLYYFSFGKAEIRTQPGQAVESIADCHGLADKKIESIYKQPQNDPNYLLERITYKCLSDDEFDKEMEK